jgi:hypothetical protein
MTVYVDKPKVIRAKKNTQAYFAGAKHGHKWCHMFADTLEELHAMAEKIGMKREWFQEHPRFPHYDLVPPRRAKAVALGAKEKDTRDILQDIALKMKAELESAQDAVVEQRFPALRGAVDRELVANCIPGVTEMKLDKVKRWVQIDIVDHDAKTIRSAKVTADLVAGVSSIENLAGEVVKRLMNYGEVSK